jgi:hypothetical protein
MNGESWVPSVGKVDIEGVEEEFFALLFLSASRW